MIRYGNEEYEYGRAPQKEQMKLEEVRKAIKKEGVFFRADYFMHSLEINLVDRFFRQAFADDPIGMIEELIQYGCIRMYDFSFLLDEERNEK